MPRLAFYGSSLVSSYWNGAATYYRGLLQPLAALGWDITFCEPDAYDRQALVTSTRRSGHALWSIPQRTRGCAPRWSGQQMPT